MLIALSAASALACGGFFCNNDQPVDQSAERILFAHDPVTGEVETHVQVFYDGPSEDFAWVVPMPSVPEVFVSSDALFDDLAITYMPRFDLQIELDGRCIGSPYNTYNNGGGSNGGGYGGYGGGTTGGYSPGVIVIDTKTVGAYETVTLQADDRDLLVQWLDDNGFDLPATIGPALDPYVAGGSFFVAMRLAKGEDAGSLQPIGFRYPADGLSVPIQLTAIAAQPDTRLEVYVLGEHRAVPESYLHVQINQAAIHWFSGADNYDDVVTQAANEAGGHAFATDFVGPTSLPDDRWYRAEQYDTAAIATSTDPVEAIELVQRQFEPTVFLLSVLEDFVPPPDGVAATDFYNAPWSYTLPPDYSWDPAGLAIALEERIVEPMVRVGELFDAHPMLTRLTSSLDAAEMTVDPVFTYNDAMPQSQALDHLAIDRHLCGPDGMPWDEAPRQLELPDGRIIDLPSQQWFADEGISEDDYLAPLGRQAAMVIEQTSGEGMPVPLTDNGSTQDELAETLATAAMPTGKVEGEGCGCTSASGPAGWLALLPLLLATTRRRTSSLAPEGR